MTQCSVYIRGMNQGNVGIVTERDLGLNGIEGSGLKGVTIAQGMMHQLHLHHRNLHQQNRHRQSPPHGSPLWLRKFRHFGPFPVYSAYALPFRVVSVREEIIFVGVI